MTDHQTKLPSASERRPSTSSDPHRTPTIWCNALGTHVATADSGRFVGYCLLDALGADDFSGMNVARGRQGLVLGSCLASDCWMARGAVLGLLGL